MKIVADTNVLISATFWKGASHTILLLVEQKNIELLTSKAILEEFSQVLNYEEIQNKIHLKNLHMKYTIQKIIELATIIDPKTRLNVIHEDPEDNKILECAKEGKADYIISQDKHLLNLKTFEGIPIIHPEDFTKKITHPK